MDPPARNSMWRFGYPNPVNYNDNELFCGGYAGPLFRINHINRRCIKSIRSLREMYMKIQISLLIILLLFLLLCRLVQWVQNKGQCGVCGDAYHLKEPRPHEAGGEYAKGTIVRHYTVGQVISFHHLIVIK